MICFSGANEPVIQNVFFSTVKFHMENIHIYYNMCWNQIKVKTLCFDLDILTECRLQKCLNVSIIKYCDIRRQKLRILVHVKIWSLLPCLCLWIRQRPSGKTRQNGLMKLSGSIGWCHDKCKIPLVSSWPSWTFQVNTFQIIFFSYFSACQRPVDSKSFKYCQILLHTMIEWHWSPLLASHPYSTYSHRVPRICIHIYTKTPCKRELQPAHQ